MSDGFYSGGTFGIPTPIGGVGGGLYVDSFGNLYPQIYYGTLAWERPLDIVLIWEGF